MQAVAPEPGVPAAKRRRRRAFVVTAVVLVGLLVVSALAVTQGWSLEYHTTCETGAVLAEASAVAPVVLLNSPYNGSVYALAGLQPGSPIGSYGSLGTSAFNGSVSSAGLGLNLAVVALHNATAAGPGAVRPCTQPYQAEIMNAGSGLYVGILLTGPGNWSDVGEPSTVFPWDTNVTFDNSFSHANAPSVSTCNGSAVERVVRSSHLTEYLHTNLSGQPVVLPFNIPLSDAVFHYNFPADLGTWQVDNLSEPGGPGGGWAFSYSPCS